MLNPEDLGHQFSFSGDVEVIYKDWWVITTSIQIVLGLVAVGLVMKLWELLQWVGRPELLTPEEMPFMSTTFVVALMALFAVLYILYYQGMPRVFVCTNGLIIRRNPVDPRERILRWLQPWTLYGYIPYESIIGFTEDWETIHINSKNNAIFVISLTFQFLSQKDKMALLDRLQREKQNRINKQSNPNDRG